MTATATWDREADRFFLLADACAGRGFVPEPFAPDTVLASVLFEVDEGERDTGRIAGIEIIGFLEFDRWEDVPSLPILWKLPGEKALPIKDVLRHEQQRVRSKAGIRA